MPHVSPIERRSRSTFPTKKHCDMQSNLPTLKYDQNRKTKRRSKSAKQPKWDASTIIQDAYVQEARDDHSNTRPLIKNISQPPHAGGCRTVCRPQTPDRQPHGDEATNTSAQARERSDQATTESRPRAIRPNKTHQLKKTTRRAPSSCSSPPRVR